MFRPYHEAFDSFLAPPLLAPFPSEALIVEPSLRGSCFLSMHTWQKPSFPWFSQAAPEPQSSAGEHHPGEQTLAMTTHTQSLDHPGHSFSPAWLTLVSPSHEPLHNSSSPGSPFLSEHLPGSTLPPHTLLSIRCGCCPEQTANSLCLVQPGQLPAPAPPLCSVPGC